ncbi:MAG TPA: MBL fold metallo-hydrolase [Dehalococcoidia bacterium]|jgi:glyoxylase-like metal-dependent hydrolase (beta-lactamase superfamily II)|nr:MBL fold metallo-hydrolase [Dehalococcoidia bacterium]
MQITDHIHSIPVSEQAFYTGPQAPNVFLVRDGDEGALIDSGFGDEKSIEARLGFLKEHPGLRLKYIVLTHHHFDHSSGASQIRQATGAEVTLHPQEEKFLRDWQSEAPQDIEIPEDQKDLREKVKRFREQAAEAEPTLPMNDGDEFSVGVLTLRIIHTPGHTLGSVCIYCPQERALFTGDTALGLGTVAISPPPHGDMALYLQSLAKLQTIDSAVMLPGHGIAVHDVPAKLQELIDHRHAREEQILKLMAKGKRTVKAMLGVIYPELDKRLIPSATRQIEAHLAKLAQEQRAKQDGEEWSPSQ